MVRWLGILFGALASFARTHRELALENLALRQQLAVWRRASHGHGLRRRTGSSGLCCGGCARAELLALFLALDARRNAGQFLLAGDQPEFGDPRADQRVPSTSAGGSLLWRTSSIRSSRPGGPPTAPSRSASRSCSAAVCVCASGRARSRSAVERAGQAMRSSPSSAPSSRNACSGLSTLIVAIPSSRAGLRLRPMSSRNATRDGSRPSFSQTSA
jgi:hypothetical protein